MEPYKEVSVNSGENITLTCDEEGTPAPRVIWQIGTRIVANFTGKKIKYILCGLYMVYIVLVCELISFQSTRDTISTITVFLSLKKSLVIFIF